MGNIQEQKIIKVFTKEEVENLNSYQESGIFHQFTCGNNHDGERNLVATQEGWICPSCDYTQDWAHDFMKKFKKENHLSQFF